MFDRAQATGMPSGLLILVSGALFTSFLLALMAFWTRRYRTAPEFEVVLGFMMRDAQWLKWRFLGNMRDAVEINARKVRWKIRYLSLALAALLVDVLAVAGYLIWTMSREGKM